ncbi:methylated-DNA--[protein]-cysteine S-methyltransferase [Imhoffiella purpurea]|uniref:methylated-DNA--[protein]-cysteine S-methyltransferase n=1 Tax=Imhoffiella purpurea TaxID=1249627 RepID=W9VGF7_9GAMM|nr:methylated-DNA--[protein]-cysteine S-methyltransferase [Imhoffiella purpurea]EXJ15122.1 Methylated-DNA--protein-cysteine methyltransferase [Imhoffiella purpurea]
MPSNLLDTPIGTILIHWRDRTLTGIDLEPNERGRMEAASASSPVPEFIAGPLRDYFASPEVPFDLSLELSGTDYQRRVWSLLRGIPAGQTRTYGELALALGSAARAVGQACRANPCLIVVPCHRVVARQGLGGFAGDTSGRRLGVKRWLLRHEGIDLQGDGKG